MRVHRQEESKHERPGKQCHLFDFSIQIAEIFSLGAAEVGAPTAAWVAVAGTLRKLRVISLPQPRCFQIKQCSSMAVWTLPLLLDHFTFGNGAQKKSTATSQCVPVLSFPQRCHHLARFLQAFSNASLYVTFQKTSVSFWFFSPSLSYLILSFSPFTSVLLGSQQHSSVCGFFLVDALQELFFSLNEASLNLANCCTVFLFMNWHLLLRKYFTVKSPLGYRYDSPFDFVLNLWSLFQAFVWAG